MPQTAPPTAHTAAEDFDPFVRQTVASPHHSKGGCAPLEEVSAYHAEHPTNWIEMGFGEGLRSAREERGIALDDIAIATRVSLRNLSALEAERFRELPGGVFNRGIVRSYARYVGLDEDATVTAFTDALRRHGVDPEHENDNWAEFAENVKRTRTPRFESRRARWAGVAVLVLAVLLLATGVTAFLARRGILQLPPKLAAKLHLLPKAARHTPVQPSPDSADSQ